MAVLARRLGAALTVLVLLISTLVGWSVPAGATPAASATSPGSPGYWAVATDGGVYQFGTANYGGMRGHRLNQPIVGAAATDDGLGYWEVAADGGIFAFGDAGWSGSAGGIHLNKPIVGMAADPVNGGYWMVASDGGVFSYGGAGFYGSTGNIHLNEPIVGMAPTPDGGGYWLVASDGGVFAFGDAGFYGSTGSIRLNKPVVGMAATADGAGYWLVASDGGIFAFGDAPFDGSAGGLRLAAPIVGMVATAGGGGYWLAGSDGSIFNYGDAPFLGAPASSKLPAPITAVIATGNAYPFPPGSTGYDISQWQCPSEGGTIPSTSAAVAVVQVSGGGINNSPNPCYGAEAQWAGAGLSAYIFMDELPSTAPPESMSGPYGNCAAGDTVCEGGNFGYYWARYWVQYSRNAGYSPSLWWLDVERPSDFWSNQSTASNAAVISGAVDGLRSESVNPGIYSTAYQWGVITGNIPSFPGIPLWVPGAGNIDGGTYSAVNFCDDNAGSSYQPFAGGDIVVVQYGYTGNGYTGPSSAYDQDYACQ